MTPEQEEAVRRALAGEPSAGAMPADVTKRLEATLAGLVAERAEPGSEVADLAAARRRRWPAVLVAAASVSVLAVGAASVLQNNAADTGSADTTSAEAGADSADTARGGAGPSQDHLLAASPSPEAYLALGSGPARLRSQSLEADVSRVVADRRAAGLQGGEGVVTLPEDSAPAAADARRRLAACALPDTGEGDLLVAVRLDGKRGTLLVRSGDGGTRVAEVYACNDTAEVLAKTTLDAR